MFPRYSHCPLCTEDPIYYILYEDFSCLLGIFSFITTSVLFLLVFAIVSIDDDPNYSVKSENPAGWCNEI